MKFLTKFKRYLRLLRSDVYFFPEFTYFVRF